MTTAKAALRALVTICGPLHARPGGSGEVVAGRRARFVAAPASTAAVTDTLRLAADDGWTVLPRGAGTKIDWGVPPPGVDLLLDTGRLAGMWQHRTDELTAEIGTGTSVRAVQAALALSGQRLALDPPSTAGTLGGVLAVNESGPLRHRFGTSQEQVCRYHYVDADGVAREEVGPAADPPSDDVGAPVGVLVSAQLRLQPRPQTRRWLRLPVNNPLQVRDAVAATRQGGGALSAVEVDLPVAGPRRTGEVAALLEGDLVDVRDAAAGLTAALGPAVTASDAAPAWWGRYPFAPGDVALRLTVDIDDLYAVVYALQDVAGTGVAVRGSAGSGTVHAVLSGRTPPQRVEEILDTVRVVLLARGGRCVVVAAPPAVRSRVEMAGRNDMF